MSQQWFFRTWYEFKDIFRAAGNSFVYFDTLTYSNKHLPNIRKFAPFSDPFPCFDSSHIRQFIESLRIFLKRQYSVEFRHFLSSEYGTRLDRQHRPHYHILFFVRGDIDPLEFSRIVADYWQYGRTDGMPYKSQYYVLTHNYIKSATLEQQLRVCNYVTKYVQKSCLFDKEISRRINAAMFSAAQKLAPDCPEDWISSPNGKRYRMQLKRHINQFHRQSQHFGESALADLDLDQLFRDGCLWMPSFKSVTAPIALSTYYKRKLFYTLEKVDGCRVWVLNDLGKEYARARNAVLVNDLKNRFECAALDYHLNIDGKRLAEYVYNERGCIIAPLDDDYFPRLESATLFNYSTLSDLEHLGCRGVFSSFRGNNSIGYTTQKVPFYKFSQFIAKYVYLDDALEHQLNEVYSKLVQRNERKQMAYELKQRLTQVFRPLLE